jgi:hypothetical protein
MTGQDILCNNPADLIADGVKSGWRREGVDNSKIHP